MHWALNQNAKPHLFMGVAVRYLGGMGRIVQCEGFWIGYGWGVIGEKYRVPFDVTEWSYLPSEI